jgi:hypothetical protein
MKEIIEAKGIFKFTFTDVESNEVKEEVIVNTLMNDYLDEIIKVLLGTSTNYQVKYLAVGTSTASVLTTQSSLGAEFFRTPVEAFTKSSTGQVKNYFRILANEATSSIIREWGIFCGTTASLTSNSGRMMTRILLDYDKTSGLKEVQIERTDILQRTS